jgi:hypothetical protein
MLGPMGRFKFNFPGFEMGIGPSSSEVCSGKGAAAGLPRPLSLGSARPGGCSSRLCQWRAAWQGQGRQARARPGRPLAGQVYYSAKIMFKLQGHEEPDSNISWDTVTEPASEVGVLLTGRLQATRRRVTTRGPQCHLRLRSSCQCRE